MRLCLATLLRAAGVCLLLPGAVHAQEGTEIVRGRVLAPDGQPVPGAIVTITGVVTQAARTTPTNDRGVYTALFASGEGDYVVAVRSIGFAPSTVRVARSGDATVLVADVTLALLPVQLEAVTVMAERPRPTHSADRPSTGGAEREALSGALFSLDPSDLIALAAAVPGVLAIPEANGDAAGFSVLGTPPDQNNIVVDGSSFGRRSILGAGNSPVGNSRPPRVAAATCFRPTSAARWPTPGSPGPTRRRPCRPLSPDRRAAARAARSGAGRRTTSLPRSCTVA